MKRIRLSLSLGAALALSLGACSPKPASTDAASARSAASVTGASPATQPTTLKELATAYDWTGEKGQTLSDNLSRAAKALLAPMTREQTIEALGKAGYECQYGEGHPDYPNPIQVCTRECQMTWEISTLADKAGKTTEVDADFKRDCVGTDKDWPTAVNSAIDNQLAPASPKPQ